MPDFGGFLDLLASSPLSLLLYPLYLLALFITPYYLALVP